MPYNSDYSKSSNLPACSYNVLSNYHANAMLPLKSAGPAGQVVPKWKPIGYDALTHGKNGCGCDQYFSITDAYGKDAGCCKGPKYVTRLCGSKQPVANKPCNCKPSGRPVRKSSCGQSTPY